MELWLVTALLTVVLYGLGEGLSKEPTVRLGPGRMLALYSVYSVPIYVGWFLLGAGWTNLAPLGVAFAIGSGLCGAVGTALWFVAVERGNASVVSGFTGAYPVVTVAMAVVLLGATLVPMQVFSIALLLIGASLLGVAGSTGGHERGQGWIALIILAILLWGAWGVLEKLAILDIGFAGTAGLYVLVSTPLYLLFALRTGKEAPPWERRSVLAAQPPLLLFAAAGITMFLAIGLGPVAIVVPLTTTYPLVAILVRRLWKSERMTSAQTFAIALAMLGALLISLSP